MTSPLAAVHSSNMAPGHKSAIRRFWEQAKGGGMSVFGRAPAHLRATGETFRQGGESILMGGLLAAAHVELPNGLDVKAGKITVPIDAAAAAVGLLGGIALAAEEGGTDLRNAGSAAATVFAFRKTYDFMAEKKKSSGGKVGGSFGGDGQDYGMDEDDAVMACAKELG